ncbi:hypothetical protein LIER_23787 [Lithospermum erythrorhizon]|uniref:Uncharacterized protein n=1 Tax=Lithospermum erythrorhizon TaxID=34254 RepID=A0AAV3R1J3_LITER
MDDSDEDACRVVEPQVVQDKSQNVKGQKKSKRGKGERSKAPASTYKKGAEGPVLNPTPIRSIPHVDTTHEVIQEAQPLIHNFYLSWVDYTNVRELGNPSPSLANRDDGVGGED